MILLSEKNPKELPACPAQFLARLTLPGLLYCFGFANVVELADVRFFGPNPLFLRHSVLDDSLGPCVLTFLLVASSVSIVEGAVVEVEGPAVRLVFTYVNRDK